MLEFLYPMALVCLGLLMLTGGAEALVEGSLRLASRLGLNPLVAGLTIVAFGTSCPELGVSMSAVINDVSNVAIGNVLGSNVANALLILGIGALTKPFRANIALVRIEIPFLFAINIIAIVMAIASGTLSKGFGLIGLSMFGAYIFYLYKSRANPAYCLDQEDARHTGQNHKKGVLFEITLSILGLIALVYGSDTFIKGALRLGHLMNVPELFIGLTLAAIGTSLPEIAATISAARRGTGDVIIGNVIGSNLANLCLVLGLTSLVKPVAIEEIVLTRDFPMVFLSTVTLLLLIVKKGPIKRWQGLVLLLGYGTYISFVSIQ